MDPDISTLSGDEEPSYSDVWQPPSHFNFTRDVFEPLATDSPLRTGMTFVDRLGVIEKRSFAKIATDASRWAALLRAHGLVDGDRLLVLLGRTPTWPSVVLGALKAGLVVVPCSESVDARELDARAAHSGAALIVTDGERAAEVARMTATMDVLLAEDAPLERPDLSIVEPSDTAATDPALIYYTSHTGDEPRGVVYTHGYTWALRLQTEYWLDAHPDDIVWCTDEVGSARGMRNLLFGPWSRGAETVIHEGEFDAEQHCELIQRLGVTILCYTPDEYRGLADLPDESRRGIQHLRHAVSEGRMLGPDVTEAFQEAFGVSIFDGYAGPESALLVANMPREGTRHGSIGRPLPGHEVAVIDADCRELPIGEEGEIAVWGRPPSLFSGYWNAPDATDAVFRGGWYLTGDRGARADGYLWLSVSTGDAAPEAPLEPPLLGALAILPKRPAAAEVATAVAHEAAEGAYADEEQPAGPATNGVAAQLEQEAPASAHPNEVQQAGPAAKGVVAPVEQGAPAAAQAREERPTSPARMKLVVARQPEDDSTAKEARPKPSLRNPSLPTAPDDDVADSDENTLTDVLVARVRAYGHAEPR